MLMREFYSRFVASDEKSVLFEALRRLSQLDDLGVWADEEPEPSWAVWEDSGPGLDRCLASGVSLLGSSAPA
jgi:hypothetical protein